LRESILLTCVKIKRKHQKEALVMIEKMEFGRTGHKSTRLLFGAAAFYNTTDPDDVKKTMDTVDRFGINHIDTARGYNKSEEMLGPWLKHNRERFFLATKTEARSFKDAMTDLEKSLDFLKTDHVDLWQMHCLAEPEEWEKARDEENGAIRAFREARDKGLVRFLGVTSHGMKAPVVLKSAVDYFDFDSVLLPYNYPIIQDNAYNKAFCQLYEDCKKRNRAIQIIKTIAIGPYPDAEGQTYNTWYKPLVSQSDINTAVSWAMNLENSFINSAAEMSLLEKIAQAADTNRSPVTDEQMRQLAEKTGMTNLFA